MISICCCTYNSLEYLKILYSSVKRNTKLKYEFLVHDNASTDGTKEWLEQNKIKYSIGLKNEGFTALNYAAKMASYDYIFFPNADNYLLPNWDIEIFKQINNFKSENIEKFIIATRAIEPSGNNNEYLIYNCGHNDKTFDEGKLLKFCLTEMKNYDRENTIQYNFPNCIPRKLFEEMGGFDMDYQPGWSRRSRFFDESP